MPRSGRRSGRFTADRSATFWALTYSDMVTLLLTFFILLFTFSTIDLQKFEKAVISIRGALGILEGGRALERENRTNYVAEDLLEDINAQQQELDEMEAMVSLFVRRKGLEGTVLVAVERRGVVLRIADRVLFDLGKADLRPESREVLDGLAELVTLLPNHIRVEGHTDNLPIHTQLYPSNWELSTSRATRVIRYLIEEHGVSPARLSAAGYGEYRPIATNLTDEGRQQNRRVDIVILRPSYERGEDY